MITTIVGGIGLFLLGMVLMTDGLKAAAGDALKGILARFTGGPVSSVVSGATLTALVQSSSATVLTTIGFVSAGLLTFPQAVGVIFGANLGTTSTGWIVSLLGLKLNVGVLAFPLVGAGALMRLLGRGRVPSVGLAIAGFGLIFVGIDVLQSGLETLGGRIDLSELAGSGLRDRFLLVGIGVVMTVVMQSSSAAVATTLTALYTGTIGIEQAAALVVGQNVGTTVTAGLAAIGATVPARRTALAHVLFNVVTGSIAFFLIPTVLHLELWLGGVFGGAEPALVIAGFHTGFNVLGVALLLPFIRPFSRLVTRLVPDRGPALTRFLDPSLVEIPAVAVEATRRTVLEVAGTLVEVLRRAADRPDRRLLPLETLESADSALAESRRFLARLHGRDAPHDENWHLSLLHAIDHLDRLIERLRTGTPARPVHEEAFDRLRTRAAVDLKVVLDWLRSRDGDPPPFESEALASEVARLRRTERRRILEATAAGAVDPDTALAQLEAMRWLDSSLYHVWRTVHHLAGPHARADREGDPEHAGADDPLGERALDGGGESGRTVSTVSASGTG